MTKHLLTPALVGLIALSQVACETRYQRRSRTQQGGFRPPPTQTEEPMQEPTSSEPSNTSRRREVREEPTPTDNTPPPPPTQEPVKTGDLPYAKGVAGKPGFVTSPYAPAAGYIDVRGFPPGTEVKDPYSGKTFLVP
jgi:hypothetical protein